MKKEDLELKLEEAKTAEESGDFFSSSFLYTDATEIARNLGDSTSVTFCKNKVVEMNRKSKSAYKELSVEQQVPNEDIEKAINPILEGTIEEILKKIGASLVLYPVMADVEKTAQGNMPISYQIANLSTRSESGHLVKGGTDGNLAWTIQMYSICQGIISELFLSRIFTSLKEKGLDKENFISYLRSSGIFPENNLKLIEVGIDKYLNNDYVSAIHILIPQFEGVFLYISEKLGIDIVSLNRGKEISTQIKTLSSEYLSSEKFQNKWGRDFCEQIKFVLFEPLGYTLRHKVAHGQISIQECNLSNSNLILYFFLVLAGRVGVKFENV